MGQIQMHELHDTNVVKLQTGVYDQIERFLNIEARNSEHTAINYEGDIKRFFKRMKKNKEIEQITEEDLLFTKDEIEDYYSYLLEYEKLAISTANRYIAAIRKLFSYLKGKNLIDDISFLDITTTSDNANSHGILTFNEIEKMAKLVLYQGKKETGLIKHYLIRFSVDTCARITECLILKWSDFRVKKDDEDVEINVIGKGNKKYRFLIDKVFYYEMVDNLKTDESEYVFNIHRNTVTEMMGQLRNELRIPKNRNIVFHSFRKAAVDRIWKETRDINQARKAANHSSIKTTMLYLDIEEDYGVMGYYSTKNRVDNDLYNKASRSELMKVIGDLDKGQQMHINLRLQKLLKEKYFTIS